MRGFGRRFNALFALAGVIGVAPIMAPQLLAFPYHARSGAHDVWSENPLPAEELSLVLARADQLVATSTLARQPEARSIFLTKGGWRWRWLALGSAGGFGLTRSVNEAVILNRSNLASDRAFSSRHGRRFGGVRTISGVIAHEICHGFVRRHVGVIAHDFKPTWLREGYCDFVANESSLTRTDVAELKSLRQDHPALVYFEGRQRVAAELAANGNDVAALFAAH